MTDTYEDKPWFGIYRGIVENNNDPEALHRVTAIVPQVFGDNITKTTWAWPCFPPGWSGTVATVTGTALVPTIGTVNVTGTAKAELFVPAVGVGVWIAFEGGDVDYPLWLGVWS